MVRRSRIMSSSAARPKVGLATCVLLLAFAAGYAWLLWYWPLRTLGVSMVLISGVVLQMVLEDRRRRIRLRALAESRSGESICSFVRNIPIRQVDTLVVRVVVEILQDYMKTAYPGFPLRPSDRLVEDLRIDIEDLFMELGLVIAHRSGRAFRHDPASHTMSGNPRTVEDLIRYWNAQPVLLRNGRLITSDA